jgi:hypothetical protein
VDWVVMVVAVKDMMVVGLLDLVVNLEFAQLVLQEI